MIIDFMAIPFDSIMYIIGMAQRSGKFSVKNEGFVFMFMLVVYPLLYLATEQVSLAVAFIAPVMGILYLSAPSIFID